MSYTLFRPMSPPTPSVKDLNNKNAPPGVADSLLRLKTFGARGSEINIWDVVALKFFSICPFQLLTSEHLTHHDCSTRSSLVTSIIYQDSCGLPHAYQVSLFTIYMHFVSFCSGEHGARTCRRDYRRRGRDLRSESCRQEQGESCGVPVRALAKE